MGQPSMLKTCYPIYRRRTQGTETSKYLEEEKITMIPKVVASEMGIAQTKVVSAILGL